MIVCGVNDRSLRERLLRDADLTLEKAIAAGHAAEETKRHAKELRSYQDNADVHKVNRRMGKEHKKHDKDKHIKQNKYENDIVKKCKFCNSTHLHGNCPAYGKKCRSCKRKNHFEICCPRRDVKAVAVKFDDSYSEVSPSAIVGKTNFSLIQLIKKAPPIQPAPKIFHLYMMVNLTGQLHLK